MVIHHDGKIDKNHPIFIRHGLDENLMARRNRKPPTMLGTTMGVFYKILERMGLNITKTAYATHDPLGNINTLIKTNSCVGCDLVNAVLTDMDLSGANFSFADLTGADLDGADLSNADFNGANLSIGFLGGTPFSETNLSGANLGGANLTGADFSGANWINGIDCGPGSIGFCAFQNPF